MHGRQQPGISIAGSAYVGPTGLYTVTNKYIYICRGGGILVNSETYFDLSQHLLVLSTNSLLTLNNPQEKNRIRRNNRTHNSEYLSLCLYVSLSVSLSLSRLYNLRPQYLCNIGICALTQIHV